MTKTLTAAGYIIVDNEAIWGVGTTVDFAWARFEREMAHGGVELLDDDADSEQCSGSWARRWNFKVMPATAALMQEVEDKGGTIGWFDRGGVACTREEHEGDAA